MADGGLGPDPFLRSHFMSEIEQGPSPQQMQAMSAPFGGTPEQASAFLQSPGMAQAMHQYGLSGFNPQQVRQSPFFPNPFMQQHPHMGGALTGAMANAAMTPEAPMVSGVGSGISRAFQGMMGGPEMLRHYQLRQMLAPLQAMGMMMPAQEEQRRWQLLQALEQDLHHRQEMPTQSDLIKNQVYAPAGAPGYFTQGQVPQNTPMPGGAGPGQVSPHQEGMPMPGSAGQFGGQQNMMAPGGPTFHAYDPQQVAALSRAKDPQKGAQAGLLGAKTRTEDEMREPRVATEKTKGPLNQARARQAGAAAAMDQAHAALFGAEAGQVAAGHGLGGSQLNPSQRVDQDYTKGLSSDEDMALKEVTAVYADPKLTDQQKAEYTANVRKWLDGRKAARQPGYETGLQHGNVAPGPISPGAGGTPRAGGGAASRPGGGNQANQAPNAAPQPTRPVPSAQIKQHNPKTGQIQLQDGTILEKGTYSIQ